MKFNLETIDIEYLTGEEISKLNDYIQTLEKSEYFEFLFKCFRQYNDLIIKIKYNENILEKNKPVNSDEYLDAISNLYKTAKDVKEFLTNNSKVFKLPETIDYVLSLDKTEIYKFMLNCLSYAYSAADHFGTEKFLANKKFNCYRDNYLNYVSRENIEILPRVSFSERREKNKLDNLIDDIDGIELQKENREYSYLVDYEEIDNASNYITETEEKETEIYSEQQRYKLFKDHENWNLDPELKKWENHIKKLEKYLSKIENERNGIYSVEDEDEEDDKYDQNDSDTDDSDADFEDEDFSEEKLKELEEKLKELEKELADKVLNYQEDRKLIDDIDFLGFSNDYHYQLLFEFEKN